jgi:FrmR/RcnR family transcriptional regulator, repressor of rcnA expression
VAPSLQENSKLLRVRQIRGQVEAVELALENEIGFSEVLELIAGARGVLNSLLAELLDDYIRTYIAHPSRTEQAYAVAELVDIIRSYLR